MKRSINVVGTGNVGTHLARAFRSISPEFGFEVRCISSRTLDEIDTDAILTVIAVSDSAIDEVASRLPDLSGIVAHTSGATPLSVLSGRFSRAAVFYPLQSLSAAKTVNYRNLPILIEAADENDFTILEDIAGQFSDMVSRADSDTRGRLHVGAVFANNFTNHMIAQAEAILEKEGLDKSFLQPLIQETFSKISSKLPS